jgi:hypothetical protein
VEGVRRLLCGRGTFLEDQGSPLGPENSIAGVAGVQERRRHRGILWEP